MKATRLISALILAGSFQAYCAVPDGYYKGLEGKSGDELRAAVKAACLPDGFATVDYNSKTWSAFEKTDVRLVGDQPVWWDMYSNKIVYVAIDHASLNIEHSVANSWWGGKSQKAPYEDLFHLNPSDADANNKKSDYPMGVVANARILDNGCVKIGDPVSGYGGGCNSVFEPADEYKGDFARAYLYVFTAYDDIPWKSDKLGNYMLEIGEGSSVPQKWVVDMLLEWSKEDPVDDKELARNEEIYAIQKNRNPFIDYPVLAEYIWGERNGEAFSCAESGAEAVNRPAAPVFSGKWMRGINTYYARWWDSETLPVDAGGGDLWISLDGGDFERFGDGITVRAATGKNDTRTLRAYTESCVSGYVLRSPVTTLSMVALDPGARDYSRAVWEPVSDMTGFSVSDYYILMSGKTSHVMGFNGGTSSVKYLPDAGFVRFDGKHVSELPTDAALVRFIPAGGADAGKYVVEVSDPHAAVKGFMNTTASNNMRLNATAGTAATLEFSDAGEVLIGFGELGTLKYNRTQPRFLNYKPSFTSGDNLRMYRFLEFPKTDTSAVETPEAAFEEPVVVSGRTIFPGDGGAVYEAGGRRVSGENLAPGIYIAVTRAGKAVKIMIR